MGYLCGRVNFPSGCHVIGNVLIFKNDEIETRTLYFEDVHEELHFFGPTTVEPRPGGGLQTKLTLTIGQPPEVFLG